MKRPASLRRPVLEAVSQDEDKLVLRRPQTGRTAYRSAKRCLDVAVSATALVLLSPVLGLAALLVRRSSPGPVLFRQTRVGLGGQPFTMLKFRTMLDGCSDELHRDYVQRLLDPDQPAPEPAGTVFKLENDPRLTSVGRVLRRTSVDELPQLVNVLRGDMSLVGPRPVLPWEAALLGKEYGPRFDVPAGMTGLWQTSGRSRLTMRQALDLDLEYVRRRGMLVDLVLLARTVPALLRPGDAE